MPRRVALFGGTFDPIHLGHLAAARAARGVVDEVIFVPAGQPPHKPHGPQADAESRWLMTVLATLEEPSYRVARWELDRPGKSYAIDTVRLAHAALGADTELYWVIGTDAMALIHTWHEAAALFALTRFLVVAREGLEEAELRAVLARNAPDAPADAMVYVPMPQVPVSSTALRARLAAGDRAADWLSPAVATYIERYGLYRTPAGVGGPGT